MPSAHQGTVQAAREVLPVVRQISVTSVVFNNTRTLRVYLPPGYDATEAASTRYPTLYLNDGFSVFAPRGWDVSAALDTLIAAGTIDPVIVVGIDSAATIGGAAHPDFDRTSEYLPYPTPYEPDVPTPRGEAYRAFLFDEVMPQVERAFRVDTANVSLGGSSYGAIAALYVSLKPPRPLTALILESPPLFMFDERLTALASTGVLPPTIYVGIGTKETDDLEILTKGAAAIQRFVDTVSQRGAHVVVNRVEGATHNAAAWKARFPTAMTALYMRKAR